ncbi:MAG TPA: hypothetical protein VJ999_11025 [Candidatus Sulfotelmatobacter sp.]|nr:hypothetical protein [Candidatus Sulfotelmatobacter sp.]
MLPPSAKGSQVVVACLDGQRLKGYVHNFLPTRDSFRLFPAENSPHEAGRDVRLSSLKAIFFVKDLAGHGSHRDAYDVKNLGHGRKIEVTFSDGETIIGATEAYNPQKAGFFLFPADPESNNIRVFILNRDTVKVVFL